MSESPASGSAAGGASGPPAMGMRAAVDNALAWARSRPLVPLLLGAAAVVAVMAALLLWAGGPDYRVLYSNLHDGDGGRIISTLDQQGVAYKFAQGGHTLLVPADKVYKLRMQLAEKGLPSAGDAGFKIMDEEAFGISQFAEHVNYMRGLQGELAHSIEALRPVANARVHLALPERSMFVRKQQPAKATVVLTLEPGRALGAGQVDAIVHMVASSVRDLAPDNVTVVDQSGHLLSRNGTDGALDGTQLEYVHKLEHGYQQRIENILAPIVGAGNVHAQVTAQVDFTRREQTAEHYAPNQGDHPATVRSRQQSSSWNDASGNPQGIPGALTNTPPGAAASPINDPPKDTDANAKPEDPASKDHQATVADQQHGDMQRQDTTNYEVDRDVTHTKQPQGAIQRLSSAVVVNYRDATQKDGSVKPVPLDKATMAQINALVREAMGFSTQRGDTLQVVNSPFRAAPEPTAPPWWKQIDWRHVLPTVGRYLLALLIALFLYRLIVRPLRKRYQQSQLAGTGAPAIDGNVEARVTEDGAAQPGHTPAATYQHGMQRLQGMAREDPGMVAMIVRNWMSRDEQ